MRGHDKPTEAQNRVLHFIRTFVAANKYPPTRAEIAAYFGYSVNAAECHVQALRRKSLLRVTPHVARGIAVL